MNTFVSFAMIFALFWPYLCIASFGRRVQSDAYDKQHIGYDAMAAFQPLPVPDPSVVSELIVLMLGRRVNGMAGPR